MYYAWNTQMASLTPGWMVAWLLLLIGVAALVFGLGLRRRRRITAIAARISATVRTAEAQSAGVHRVPSGG